MTLLGVSLKVLQGSNMAANHLYIVTMYKSLGNQCQATAADVVTKNMTILLDSHPLFKIW